MVRSAQSIFFRWVIVVIGTFFLPLVSFCQGDPIKDFPFQVIYAEKVFDRYGSPVKERDVVEKDQVLKLENGYLSIVHYSGFPLELTGDTTIRITAIDNELSLIVGLQKKKPGKRERTMYKRPHIGQLYIADAKEGRKNKLSATGACHDCAPQYIIYPPLINQSRIYFSHGLCVMLRRNSGIYKAEVRTIFDDLLRVDTVSGDSLFFTAGEIDSLLSSGDQIVLTLHDKASDWTPQHYLLVKYESQIPFPFSCNIERATDALMAGLSLEMESYAQIGEARKFYQLAAQLSTNQFFKTMLANFNSRNP